MQRWTIEPGTHTPRVMIDSEKSLLLIEGRSYPEEGMDFYDPIVLKLRELIAAKDPIRTLHLRLEYYNSSTAKALTDLFNIMRDTHKMGVKVQVLWDFEEDDDSISEDIEMFSSSYDYEFVIGYTTFD